MDEKTGLLKTGPAGPAVYQSAGYPSGAPPVQYPGEAPAGQYSRGAPSTQYPDGSQQAEYPRGTPGAQPGGNCQGAPVPYGQPPSQAGPYPPQGTVKGHRDVQVQSNGAIPYQNVDDNPNVAVSQPIAPPLDQMDAVSGYINIGVDGLVAPLPSYTPQRLELQGLPQLQEEEVRQALLSHVAEHCCYGKGAAEQMEFADLKHSSALHYTLETFAEARRTARAYEPYIGQVIDGPHNGPAPGLWDIQTAPPTMFQNQNQHVEIPHTASVKPCHHCMSMGRIRCHRCFGSGRVRCSSCSGRGHKAVYRHGEHEYEPCHWCHGNGRKRCMICHGFGMVTCTCCQGYCQLKCFTKLTITWTNHVKDHIVERTSLPDHLVRSVGGQIAFSETQSKLWPVNHFPDPEINSASVRIVNEHAAAFPGEKLLMQRHQVRVIPVTQALYKWKSQESDFFVYGFERKVYAPNYPQQCCCGCTLL